MHKKGGKPSKAQISKEVRRVLCQFQIDLTKLHFSANGRSTYLSGVLKKNSGSDISSEEALQLVYQLSSFGMIKSELDNWYLSLEKIYYLGEAEHAA